LIVLLYTWTAGMFCQSRSTIKATYVQCLFSSSLQSYFENWLEFETLIFSHLKLFHSLMQKMINVKLLICCYTWLCQVTISKISSWFTNYFCKISYIVLPLLSSVNVVVRNPNYTYYSQRSMNLQMRGATSSLGIGLGKCMIKYHKKVGDGDESFFVWRGAKMTTFVAFFEVAFRADLPLACEKTSTIGSIALPSHHPSSCAQILAIV
jgi:hypothetical protein